MFGRFINDNVALILNASVLSERKTQTYQQTIRKIDTILYDPHMRAIYALTFMCPGIVYITVSHVFKYILLK